jgi:outer membrane protein assembly factor BamB
MRTVRLAIFLCGALICVSGWRPSSGSLTSASRNSSDLVGNRFSIKVSASGDVEGVYLGWGDTVSLVEFKTDTVLWTHKTPQGTVDNGPIVAVNRVVYVGGGGGFTVFGLDPKTGKEIWRRDHNATQIAAGEGLVFLNNVPGEGLTALSLSGGQVQWRYPSRGAGSSTFVRYYDGKVYSDSYVLNAADGKLIKEYSVRLRAIDEAGGVLFSVRDDGSVHAENSRGERDLWSVKNPTDMNPMELVATAKYVFVVFYDGVPSVAHQGMLIAFDAVDGHRVWEHPLSAPGQRSLGFEPISADIDRVFLSEPSGPQRASQIIALSAQTGSEVWSYNGDDGLDQAPVAIGDHLYTTGGSKFLVVLSKETGKLIKRISFPTGN